MEVLIRERVLKLKNYKKTHNISTSKVLKMLEESNFPLSESSVRRVFEEGSENRGFREETIAALELAFFGVEGVSSSREDISPERAMDFLLDQNGFFRELLKAKDEQLNHRAHAMMEKEETIKWHRDEIKELKAEIKELKTSNAELLEKLMEKV